MTITATTTIWHDSRTLLEPDLLPENITLRAGGEGWMGTFGVMVAALLNDILSDGAPVPGVTLVVLDEERSTYLCVTGDVASVKSYGTVVFTDGAQVAVSDIPSVTSRR